MINGFISQVAQSTPFDKSTNGFSASNVQSAIEEAKATATGLPRFCVSGVYNGTVGGGTWLGPNELLPNTPFVVFPVNTKLTEISWSNQTSDVQFRIQFRLNSRTGTILHTITVTSTNPGYGYVTGLNYTFSAGDTIHAQYLDDGQNCSDMNLMLWLARIE
jgi:hypothetical protein